MRQTPVLLTLPLLIFGAGALAAVLSTRAAMLSAPAPTTLLEATLADHEDDVVRFVTNGENPASLVVLDQSVFHWDEGEATSPLLVAIARGDISLVVYMLRHAEGSTAPPNDRALCVAAQYGHSNVARHLMRNGAPAVPKNGCNGTKNPETVAEMHGFGDLAERLRRYRLEGVADRRNGAG